MKTPGIYYGALTVFCVVALCIGFGSAAGTTQGSQHTGIYGWDTGHQAVDRTNTTFQQNILDRFDKQGVDTTALKIAFQKGDTAAVKFWFEAFIMAHPYSTYGGVLKQQTSS